MARPGEARLGGARQARPGKARLGMARQASIYRHAVSRCNDRNANLVRMQ